MDNITKLNNLEEIPKDYKYIGYLWYSDKEEPVIFENKKFSYKEDDNFIIEGYLYSEDQNISISIKFIDGKYYITKIDLSSYDFNSDSENFSKHTYLTDAAIVNKNKEFKYINFVQYWKTQKDKLCANMEVLKPNWIAFVGFSKTRNENGGNDAK